MHTNLVAKQRALLSGILLEGECWWGTGISSSLKTHCQSDWADQVERQAIPNTPTVDSSVERPYDRGQKREQGEDKLHTHAAAKVLSKGSHQKVQPLTARMNFGGGAAFKGECNFCAALHLNSRRRAFWGIKCVPGFWKQKGLSCWNSLNQTRWKQDVCVFLTSPPRRQELCSTVWSWHTSASWGAACGPRHAYLQRINHTHTHTRIQ